MVHEGFGHMAPYLPEDKAGLLAVVSGGAVPQCYAYLRVLNEACWAIQRMRIQPAFNNQWWNDKFQKNIMNLKKEEDRFFFEVLVHIFQGYPSIFGATESKFEKKLEEFIGYLESGSGPLSQQEAETAGFYCMDLLWLCQNLPSQWGEIVRVRNDKVVGALPGWLFLFNALGLEMERNVKEQRKGYDTPTQTILETLENIAPNIYKEIRFYYSQQPQENLATAVCVLLGLNFPIHLVGISPASGESKPWTELKRKMIDHNAYIKAKRATLSSDKLTAADVAFFAATARSIVSEDGVKELIAFQTVWLAYGKMLENIVKTFQINPSAKTRTDLILDLEDARDYWSEVKGYVNSFPNLKMIEKIVEVSELP